MFVPLLSDVGASPAADAAAPWFVTYLLVPILVSLLSAIVGGIITLVVGLMVVRRTAWYQRLTQADPLAQLLWEKRLSVYSEFSSQIYSLWLTLLRLADATRESKQPQREIYNRFLKQLTRLVGLHTKALPVMSQAVDEAVTSFGNYLLATANNVYDKRASAPDLPQEMRNVARDVLNVMRSDLQVEALERQTTIMLEHARSFDRES